jgi:hypothetical protein
MNLFFLSAVRSQPLAGTHHGLLAIGTCQPVKATGRHVRDILTSGRDQLAAITNTPWTSPKHVNVRCSHNETERPSPAPFLADKIPPNISLCCCGRFIFL